MKGLRSKSLVLKRRSKSNTYDLERGKDPNPNTRSSPLEFKALTIHVDTSSFHFNEKVKQLSTKKKLNHLS